jgi:proliferating cell nuclear antigen PCNA
MYKDSMQIFVYMKLKISEKQKKDIFLSLFNQLKSCTSTVTMIFKQDELYIQGMDKAHVCLFEITLQKDWFKEYQPPYSEETETVSIDSNIFCNILSMIEDGQTLCLWYDFEGESEQFNIDFISGNAEKVVFNKLFNIPLIEIDAELLNIPEVEYDVDFTIKAKKICEIASQMLVFGDVINIKCQSDEMFICSKGVNGEMIVKMSIDNLTEYSISEGECMDVCYSLTYMSKMCMTSKLSQDIEFGISAEYPMRIKYNFGNGSRALFFIAPKVE